MNQNTYLPTIVDTNPPGGYLHLAYGITEERRAELADQMNNLDANQPTRLIPMFDRIRQIGEIAQNKEEFVFCIVADMIYLQQSRRATLFY